MPHRYTQRELEQNFLFELHPHGAYVRVSAIDPITNTEINMVGDRSVGKEQLIALAKNKLFYVLRKNGLLSETDESSIGRRSDGSVIV